MPRHDAATCRDSGFSKATAKWNLAVPCLAPDRALPRPSNRKWIGLGQLAGFPLRRALQRFHRSCLIDMNYSVELFCQASSKVATDPFRFRHVDPVRAALPALFG